jgi:aquaporin Z
MKGERLLAGVPERGRAWCAVMSVLRRHWTEYVIEAALLGVFMVVACAMAVLLKHPGSPVHRAVPAAHARRALFGLAMGLTAVAIIYSPWGKRSGAHINPSVTLAFLRLGRVNFSDAAFYVAAQFVGAVGGVLIARGMLGAWLSHPATHFVTTRPGERGLAVAFVAEFAISLVLMTVVLAVTASRHARLTGLCAGALVFLYITFEAPLSGMSMNPARSFGSALVGRELGPLWIYLLAPPLGMQLAAAFFKRHPVRGCAKLDHPADVPCIFCGQGMPAMAGGVTSRGRRDSLRKEAPPPRRY